MKGNTEMAKISIDETMNEIVSIQNQINGLQMLLQNKKAIMAKFFEKSGKRRVDNDQCIVFVKENTKIEYNVDAILEKIDEELTTQFVKKEREVVDWGGFVKFLKGQGINSKELRRFISVRKKVDEDKLKKLYDLGKLSIEDLSGCYEAKVTKSVTLKMKNIEREIPIEK